VTGRRPLRRVRRVVAGTLVGGAVVLLDRRRRRSDVAGKPRGGDPLAAFESAPCYRSEGSSQG